MSCFLSTTYWVSLFLILHVKYGIKRPNSLSFFFIILASGHRSKSASRWRIPTSVPSCPIPPRPSRTQHGGIDRRCKRPPDTHRRAHTDTPRPEQGRRRGRATSREPAAVVRRAGRNTGGWERVGGNKAIFGPEGGAAGKREKGEKKKARLLY